MTLNLTDLTVLPAKPSVAQQQHKTRLSNLGFMRWTGANLTRLQSALRNTRHATLGCLNRVEIRQAGQAPSVTGLSNQEMSSHYHNSYIPRDKCYWKHGATIFLFINNIVYFRTQYGQKC